MPRTPQEKVEYTRKWREENREKSRAYMRDYMKKRRQEQREVYNDYYREYQRNWRKENPDTIRRYSRRHALKRKIIRAEKKLTAMEQAFAAKLTAQHAILDGLKQTLGCGAY